MTIKIESCSTCPLCVWDTEQQVKQRCGHPNMAEQKYYDFPGNIKENCPLKKEPLILEL